MGQEWYYTRNGEKHGPISGAELKQLAATGKLQPTDHLWTERLGKWVAARSVKGLFPSEPQATGPSTSGTVTPAGRSRSSTPRHEPQTPTPPREVGESAGGSTMRPRPGGMRISTPALVGIIVAGVLLLVIVVAVPVLILARSGKALTPGTGGDATSGPAKGGENAGTPGRSDAPDPRFKDAAEEAKAALSDVDYSKGPNGGSQDYKEWIEEGHKIKAQGFLRNRRFIQHGLTTIWYPTGEKKSERYWFNGKMHGHMVEWYRNGHKQTEGYNKDGYGYGYRIGWYENGSKKYERAFKSKGDSNDGLRLTYYRNGNLMWEVKYFDYRRPDLRTEQWYDAAGGKAAGPTMKALTRDDYLEILDYLLAQHTGDVHGQLSRQVHGGGETIDITANFNFDFYMKFFGQPDTGFDPDFVNHAGQVWTYSLMDQAATLRVTCGRPIASNGRIIPGKAERVVVEGLSFQ